MSTNHSNNPKSGSSIKVEPIRDPKAIRRIKAILSEKPRDLCLFTLGINTGYRASELLAIEVKQVSHLTTGERLSVKQKKTGKYRAVTLNAACIDSIHDLIRSKDFDTDDHLFKSQRGVLTTATLNRMVKAWCADVGLKGNYGSHTLRKTWGYMQRVKQNAPIPLLMEAFGHANQKQTLAYLCIQEKEIQDLYLGMEL